MGRGRTKGVSQAVRFLGDLIALPSVNPAFLPQSDPNAGEAAITDYLTRRAAKAKLDVRDPDGRSALSLVSNSEESG